MEAEWIDVNVMQPKETGQYNVKTNHGNSIAFWVRKKSGELYWMCINEYYTVTHWLFE